MQHGNKMICLFIRLILVRLYGGKSKSRVTSEESESILLNVSECVQHLTVPSIGGLAGLWMTLYINTTFICFCLYCEFSIGTFRIKQSLHSIHPDIIIPIFIHFFIHSDGVGKGQPSMCHFGTWTIFS